MVAIRLATALLIVTLAGCGDDAPAPTRSLSTSGSSPSSETETEPTEPAVEPATGPVIREQVATVRAPEKWITKGSQLFTDAERAPKNEAALEKGVYGFIELDVSETDEALTLDEAAREAATFPTTEGKRVDDSELGGEPAFVITENLNGFGSTDYTIGLARGERLVVLNISLLGSAKAERMAVIDSVVASWEWQQ